MIDCKDGHHKCTIPLNGIPTFKVCFCGLVGYSDNQTPNHGEFSHYGGNYSGQVIFDGTLQKNQIEVFVPCCFNVKATFTYNESNITSTKWMNGGDKAQDWIIETLPALALWLRVAVKKMVKYIHTQKALEVTK